MINDFKKIRKNKGAALLVLIIFFLFISLAIITGLVSPSVREFKITNDLIRSRQSLFLSESGVEDAYYRLKNSMTIGSTEVITIDGHTATTTITDSGYNEKTIRSEGDVSSRERESELVLTTGSGASFAYGIQTGTGGFEIRNAIVYGNVYSNGDIIATHSAALVTGSAFAAGGLIDDLNVGQAGVGDARANRVDDSTVAGNLYCQTGSGNNKACNTTQIDPEVLDMPITEEMITTWKNDASTNVYEGNMTISTPTTLGPIKITGNLTINSNVTIADTVYVVGTISTANNVQVSLHPSYGASGGVLITDSPVNLSNNATFSGSGTTGSYLLLLTTSDCPSVSCPSTNALEIANNVGAVILNAQNGTAHINNNVELNELVAEKIIMDNNAEVHYIAGLANTNFISGPQGGWNISSWQEVE
jgi:hypothetical protein